MQISKFDSVLTMYGEISRHRSGTKSTVFNACIFTFIIFLGIEYNQIVYRCCLCTINTHGKLVLKTLHYFSFIANSFAFSNRWKTLALPINSWIWLAWQDSIFTLSNIGWLNVCAKASKHIYNIQKTLEQWIYSSVVWLTRAWTQITFCSLANLINMQFTD